MLSPYLTSRSLHVLFSKKDPATPELLAAFNAGLKEIKNNGVYENILIKQGVGQP